MLRKNFSKVTIQIEGKERFQLQKPPNSLHFL